MKTLTTQVQNGDNVMEILRPSCLKDLNTLFSQNTAMSETLLRLNRTYLTMLNKQIQEVKIATQLTGSRLKRLNKLFQRSQDQQIQDLLRQINAKMESAQG